MKSGSNSSMNIANNINSQQQPANGGGITQQNVIQDKFFITETHTGNINNLTNKNQEQLQPIREQNSYGMLPMSYSELTAYNPKKKSAYDYKEHIDEMKSNLLTPWQKVIKKLQYPLNNYNYYDQLPIKPGVFIYKALVESKYPLKQLKINIPETLCVFNGLYWITTNQSGKLEVKNNDFLPRNFYDKVRELSETAYKSQYLEPLHAAVIDRKWQQFPTIGSKSVQSWEKFNDTINYGPDSESIIQQFVYSSAQKANTVRLFYYNPRAHQGQNQTYAYYMTNDLLYHETANKYRYEEKYTICSSRENSFEHFVMKGKVLEPYEYFAEQIVNFIFKSYGIRIEQIAIDFIKDERDVIYFTDVNGFKVFEHEKVSRLAMLTDDQWVEKIKEEKGIFDRANNTVQCSLCRISYKKNEVTKIVTYKMLFELRNHLYKRGIFGFEYLEKVSESTQSCKVCDICYMLVVAEHELIEVEKLYAISQNIPLEEKARKTTDINRVDTENIKGKLNQWRLLFYFQEFQDIQLSALNNQPQKTTKVILKKLRTHFFFVDHLVNLEYFLNNTEVEFRITDGPQWNKPIAFASAYPFTHFDVKLSEKKADYVQRQNILLHFFGSDLEPFYLLATTGLKKDKEIKTEKMYLYLYNQVYFPENTYYNSDPLPIEWLELFESRDYFMEIFKKEEDENKNLGFTPFCSIKELNYLEPDFKGRWNVRQEAIITGFSDTRNIVNNCTERLYPKSISQFSARSYRSNNNSIYNDDKSVRSQTRLKSANPISRLKQNQTKELQLFEKYKSQNDDELIENAQEESIIEKSRDSQQQKFNFDKEPDNPSTKSKVGGTISKDQLKLELNKLSQKLSSSQSVKNLDQDFYRYNNQKQQDFKIRTQYFNNTKNSYAQSLLQNAKQLINMPESGKNQSKKRKKIKKQKQNAAQPYFPNDMYLTQDQPIFSFRSKQSQNDKKISVRNRPYSAKPQGLSLMTTIGEDLSNIKLNQRMDGSSNQQNDLKNQQIVNLTSMKSEENANNLNQIPQHVAIVGAPGSNYNSNQIIAEDLKEENNEEGTVAGSNQNTQQIEILEQHRKNIRPISHYMNGNQQSSNNYKKTQRLLSALNNRPHHQEESQNPQQEEIQKVSIPSKTLKRPISAANLFGGKAHQSNMMNTLNPYAYHSMRQLFQIYDTRPPSGIQSLVSSKQQSKKTKKKIKIKRLGSEQENDAKQMNQYQQYESTQQFQRLSDINSPDSLSFQLSNTQQNTSGKVIVDHKITAANLMKYGNAKSQKNLQIQRPDSSQSTHLTSTRLSNFSNQGGSKNGYVFQYGQTPQSLSNIGTTPIRPNQFFSPLLQQTSQQQEQQIPMSVRNQNGKVESSSPNDDQQIQDQQQTQTATNNIQIDSMTQSQALSNFSPSPITAKNVQIETNQINQQSAATNEIEKQLQQNIVTDVGQEEQKAQQI
eukprot:403374165